MRATCLGLFFGLVLGATAANAGNMQFEIVDAGGDKVILAQGEITAHSDRAFRSALRRAGRGTPVLLHSPGGNLAGGVRLGLAFRETGTNVGIVPGGACLSACAYALLGGVNRTVSGGQFGVHSFATTGRNPKRKLTKAEIAEDREVNRFLRLYVKSLGVDPNLIGMAEATRNEKMRILSNKELKRMRVVTGG